MEHDDVFVPNEQPVHTYVARNEHKLESKLRDNLSTKNIVVSISGPSKTGKTVLFKSAVDQDLIIPVVGATIKSEFDFWSVVFAWLGEPIQRVSGSSSTSSTEGSVSVEGTGSVLVAKIKGGGGAKYSRTTETVEEELQAFNPFVKVVDEIGESDFTIFIDDFHYIKREVQPEIARIIKALAENGVKVCTASVPHRSDDVVRANPELRGRLASIDVEPWDARELEIIAKKGFPLLNIDLSPSIISKLADEAFGSPQLMQALCLNLCRSIGARTSLEEMTRVDVSEEQIADAMENTSDLANFSTMLTSLHTGPKKHGKDRKLFDFIDGSRGDVYRATLLAISRGDPRREFVYDEIMMRVKDVCEGEFPVGSSVQGALTHMDAIGKKAEANVLEWDEDTLAITDPYFAFYLRSSRKLTKLERSDQ